MMRGRDPRGISLDVADAVFFGYLLVLFVPFLVAVLVRVLYLGSPAGRWVARLLMVVGMSSWVALLGLLVVRSFPVGLAALAVPGAVLLTFWVRGLRGLAVRRCPACGRRALLSQRGDHWTEAWMEHREDRAWCASCGGWAWRLDHGPWADRPADRPPGRRDRKEQARRRSGGENRSERRF
jgi:hypothetical protein